MKIISKFRDYYDSAMAYGHDDSRTYLRQVRETYVASNAWPYGGEILERLRDIPVGEVHFPGFLLFCGRVWPVWWHDVAPKDPQALRYPHLEIRAYPGWMRHYTALRDDPHRLLVEDALLDPVECFFGHNVEDVVVSLGDMRETHEALAERPMGEELLVDLQAPVALLLARRSWHWRADIDEKLLLITNPVLRDLEFQRFRDAFSAYQEIETFLGSQLAPADTAPQRVGSDEVIARQKGFDEMSFRTAAPGAKKSSRKANRARKRGLES